MVKLPDKDSLEGFSKKVEEAVKLPNDSEKAEGNTGGNPEIPDAEIEKIRKEEREKIEEERKRAEKERIDKENAEKAKAYEKIEAEKKAEEERLTEEAKKQKEKEAWAKEEEKKQLEEEKKRAQIEKELIAKQKKEGKKKGHGGKIALAILIIIVVIIVAAYVSLITGNSVLNAYGYPMSYTSQYDVRLPDSEKLNFGPIPVEAISSGNAVTLSINNDRNTMELGESATFPAKHVIITMLGMTVYSGDYQVTTTYRGVVTNKDDFLVVLSTSEKVPGWLTAIMKPAGVDITAV